MKTGIHNKKVFISLSLLLVMAQLLIVNTVAAGGPTSVVSDVFKVPIFKSKNLTIKQTVSRVSIGNEQIADILILRAKELYIVGKKLGTTNVMVWDEEDKLVDVINLEVTHDLVSLRQRLHHFMPDDELSVQTSQGQLVISGQTSSLEKMNTAVELARGYAEAASVGKRSSEVLNMISIGGGHQVMLEVTVAEVSTEVSRKFDSKMSLTFSGSDGTGGIINGIGAAGGASLSSGFFGSLTSGDMQFDFALDVAKQNGLAKILAEPNITALSGQKAEFLAGGEFPVPVPSEDGTTIQFKDFGVGVSFVPTILDSGKINLNLKVLVSELSNSHGVGVTPQGSTSTLVVPSIVKRTSETTVELADGQTIAIGGLLSDTLRDSVNKLPGLGDLPILGQLFSSHEFISGQTELVIMVTPRLVRPFNKKGIVLPTDGFVPVSDLEFYLLGKMTEQKTSQSRGSPNQEMSVSDTILTNDGGTNQRYGHQLKPSED
ncbi:type II and III secretion system protein family protein [Colwellia sp. BRX10-3]|uniref:type II and III secretion system protein family protein n=1 Tax=Colwellia sp. BRX10-3 TaxID=2759844 RepID=UPI0015F7635A|nr:type II and III secretion system protein family protein [Colwellia sp. BRX10-3]MBA6390712.1 type II and III secretion system protein family protein [Colwellia sp. BRX10-3]